MVENFKNIILSQVDTLHQQKQKILADNNAVEGALQFANILLNELGKLAVDVVTDAIKSPEDPK